MTSDNSVVKVQNKHINPMHIVWMSAIQNDGMGSLAFEVSFVNGHTERFDYGNGSQATLDQNAIIKALGGKP